MASDSGKTALTVDEFVAARVPAQFRDIVAMLRQLIREMAPDAAEAVSYDMPTYTRKHMFAYMIASQKDVTLGFVRGVQFVDRYGLLRGKGKSARHVKIKSLENVNQAALKDFIRQALELDDQ